MREMVIGATKKRGRLYVARSIKLGATYGDDLNSTYREKKILAMFPRRFLWNAWWPMTSEA